jgi:hypothetical protein
MRIWTAILSLCAVVAVGAQTSSQVYQTLLAIPAPVVAGGGGSCDQTGTNAVTSMAPIVERDDFTGKIGWKFTTTNSPIEISGVGAYFKTGGFSHLVEIYTSGASPSLIASTNITSVANGWASNCISPTVTLSASTAYRVVVTVVSAAGDIWYSNTTDVNTGFGIYNDGPTYHDGSWNDIAVPNTGFGPTTVFIKRN